MKSTLQQLDALSYALQRAASTLPPTEQTLAQKDLVPLIRAARRKCQNVLVHHAVISGIDWNKLDELGRTSPLTGRTETLTIELHDASLIVRHRSAAVDHVYLAFDGLVTGIVNVTDTLSRLWNVCFNLKIDKKQVTLLKIRDNVQGSPLGQVLADAAMMSWLKHVRDLRGECQHAGLEEVLTNDSPAFGGCGEPCVPVEYVWSNPAKAAPLTEYTTAAIDCAEELLCGCITVIVKYGSKATVPT